MSRQLLSFVFVLVCCLTGCATPASFQNQFSCKTDLFALDIRFAAGAMKGCRVTAEDVIDVLISPEDTPINPSPWYAVRLTPNGSQKRLVTINLNYATHPHRYRPKVSTNGNEWQYVRADRVTASDDGMTVGVSVELSDTPVFLTGQELLTQADYDLWLKPYKAQNALSSSSIGRSIESRPIGMLTAAPPDPEGSVVLVGRQHPPELTGAVAMLPFVDEVLGDSQLARSFRKRFGVYVLPLLNPDGVHHGHWRHNLAGADLNRDWGPFEQPETQAVQRLINRLAQRPSTRPVAFLDFHSTRRNVFYTQLVGEDGTNYGFTQKWLERSRKRLPDYEFERAERHQSDLATSKNYMFGRFGIPSITYEVGDETDRQLLQRAARVFAQEMMSVLLENHSSP